MVNLFLAYRYAAVLIILLVGTGPDPRPVWCNAPLPLCNQAQTRWLKVLLRLPVWKALSDPHQCHYSHGLQTPLGSTDTTPKQSGRLFLPHDKKSLKCCFCSLTSIEFLPLPPPLYQVSRTVGLLGFGTDENAGFSMADCTLLKKRGIIGHSSFKANQKTSFFCIFQWYVGGNGLKMVCRPHISASVASKMDFSKTGCSTYIYYHVSPFSFWFTDIVKGTSSNFTPACLSGNRLCAVCMYVCMEDFVCVCVSVCLDVLTLSSGLTPITPHLCLYRLSLGAQVGPFCCL